MKVTLLDRKNGGYVEKNNVSSLMNGSQWYWLEYANGEHEKLPTNEYQLMDVDA